MRGVDEPKGDFLVRNCRVGFGAEISLRLRFGVHFPGAALPGEVFPAADLHLQLPVAVAPQGCQVFRLCLLASARKCPVRQVLRSYSKYLALSPISLKGDSLD